MENVNWVSVIGLVIDVFGALILFKYGLPSDKYNRKLTKDELFAEKKFWENQKRDRPLKWDDYASEEDKIWAKKYECMSRFGLICVIIGFILQLLGTLFFQNPPNSNSTTKNYEKCHKH